MQIELNVIKRPDWVRATAPGGPNYTHLLNLVDDLKLHTVCQSARCPNMGECWEKGTATFMILGDVCTRACGFCAVKTGRPTELDWAEPQRVAQAGHKLAGHQRRAQHGHIIGPRVRRQHIAQP